MNCTKDEYCAALNAEGAIIMPNYTAALPARMDWFKDRAHQHPWNNPLYNGNAGVEYLTPNCDKAMDEYFVLFLLESYGENETNMLAEAFKKVDAYYSKK
jgi:hypothetical protein